MKNIIVKHFGYIILTLLLIATCVVAYKFHKEAQGCKLTAEERSRLTELALQIKEDNALIDSLESHIAVLELKKDTIFKNIDKAKQTRDEERDRIINGPLSRRDLFWTDYFSKEDTITWRQLDTLQYRRGSQVD